MLLHKLFFVFGTVVDLKDAKQADRVTLAMDAYKAMPKVAQNRMEFALRNIHALRGRKGEEAMRPFTGALGDKKAEWQKLNSTMSRAAWFFLNASEVFSRIIFFHGADVRLSGRGWKKTTGFPALPPDNSEENKKRLEQLVAEYYHDLDDSGEQFKLDWDARDNFHYYCLHLTDPNAILPKFDDAGQFVYSRETVVFDVAFAFDSARGELQVFARGTPDTPEKMKEIFCSTMLKSETPDSRPPVYRLNRVLDSDFSFGSALDEYDITSIHIKSMKAKAQNHPGELIEYDGGAKGRKDGLKVYLDSLVKGGWTSLGDLSVTRLGFAVELIHEGKERKFCFEVTPSNTDLHTKTPYYRCLGEKCLSAWGIHEC